MSLLKPFTVACLLLTGLLPAATMHAQTDYLIGAQDVLAITVFGEPELSGRYTVDEDGTFTYPQLGRITAGGTTLRALEQDLKTRLADGYLKNPQVAVGIETYRSQRILVMGEVRAPGEYQLTGEMRLLAALAKAGSPTALAGHEVLIVHAPKRGAAQTPNRPTGDTAGEPTADIQRVDLVELQAGSPSSNILLQDGDTVNVPKAQQVFVSGQVKQPGGYSVDPGTTVLKVLAMAGGITDRGSDGRISILRMVDGKQRELKVKPNDPVEPGDTVVVKERFF